ncbi:MAG: apolipoprotein N-acyltransferase [Pseudomonadota bacterium]|nr:apolipoprotein N-acyltransferase [Pseudomonadota bacterium]
MGQLKPAEATQGTRLFSRAGLPRLLAALASGLVLTFVSPPFGLSALHWFSFVPLFLALHPDEPRLNFKLGYLTGFSGVFCLFFWLAQTITIFSNIPLVLAAGIVVLFAAVWGLPYGFVAMAIHPLRRRFGAGWMFLFPAVWVGMEYLQPALFPYFQGVGQYRVPWVWQLASVFGAMGLSYLIILVNCAVAAFFLARREGTRMQWPALAAVAALWFGNLGFGAWRYASVEATLASAPVVRATILQQHVSMITRLQERGNDVLKSWMQLTALVAKEKPDLVVWPEGSIGYNPNEGKLKEIFSQLSERGGFDFLVGGGTFTRDPDDPTKRASWNSAYHFGRSGEIRGRYDKMVPLPFGEYLPWPVSYLADYIEGVGDFRAGTEAVVFNTGAYTFTTPICYEAILESQMRRLMDADLFVNITNDGWFGDTSAPHQHAMLSAVHAVELGRPMLRVAYTGVSMVVEPHGAIPVYTTPYTDVAAVVPIRMAKFETPYRTWGGWFPPLASLVGLLSLVLTFVRRAPVTPPTPPS